MKSKRNKPKIHPVLITVVAGLSALAVVIAVFIGLAATTEKSPESQAVIGSMVVDAPVTDDAGSTAAKLISLGYQKGSAIKTNGVQLALCQSKEDAQWVVDSMLATSVMEGAKSKFSVPVTIEDGYGHIIGKEEALLLVSTGTVSLNYIAQGGETAQAVCSAFFMDEAAFKTLNAAAGDTIPAGTVLKVISNAQPLLTVHNEKEVVEEEVIPFETKTVQDNTLFKGTSRVKQAGVNGLRRRTVIITYHNGLEIARDEGEYTVITEPVQKIVNEGTRKAGDIGSAPSFRWPLTGRISSKFGPRWGKEHQGIDIAVSEGTNVRAAAGGTVLRAFNNGGYGLFVEIDHGSGWVTRYAHNSKLLVKPGQEVVRGEVVALSGNTGNSTGPHLHFEIRRGGTPVDPLLYLP